ncbi:PoNe immunity protein domain-containing protein [Chryseobacterium vrystaatense]|uniref:PoNi C-terminal domain-containing protein n=1 Tax=Chryseobacterium vrystaatense TaxID=307480 RepID=A0A1M5NW95_9FLAO|nr:PoNe immunity protein domain-containing protein [Chryseobacterium vrystaatense]SHG93253.1 protein of unknown function [Chryseobacterium vrystaatense]
MRTNLKEQKILINYIDLNIEDIKYFEESIQTNKTVEDRIPSVKRKIFKLSLHTLIAKYSAGYEIQELNKEFPQVIEYLVEGWDYEDDFLSLDDYISLLWMLSIGVMLEIGSLDFDKIVHIVDKCQYKDFIYDTIISSRKENRKISEIEKFPNEFGFLKKLFENRDISELKNYLDKNWYKRMKPTYWYDNDKNKNDVFFGYWSFESAALVKILVLDNKPLKDQQYYPYDLVHWKD